MYIKPFEPINESMKQHGILLIKGKPKGKNKQQMLFATHVNTWAELRPGAMMMFLSDTFYRVIKEGDKDEVLILYSHYHSDHTIGLFLSPITFIKKYNIDI